MSAFTAHAKIERIKLQELFDSKNYTKYHFTPEDGYDKYDALLKHSGKNYIIEAKVRTGSMNSRTYDTGYILEQYKYNSLRQVKQSLQHETTVLYINFFDDGYIVFSLDKRNGMQPVSMKMNKTTAENTGKVTKQVYLIKPESFDTRYVYTSSTSTPVFAAPSVTASIKYTIPDDGFLDAATRSALEKQFNKNDDDTLK